MAKLSKKEMKEQKDTMIKFLKETKEKNLNGRFYINGVYVAEKNDTYYLTFKGYGSLDRPYNEGEYIKFNGFLPPILVKKEDKDFIDKLIIRYITVDKSTAFKNNKINQDTIKYLIYWLKTKEHKDLQIIEIYSNTTDLIEYLENYNINEYGSIEATYFDKEQKRFYNNIKISYKTEPLVKALLDKYYFNK